MSDHAGKAERSLNYANQVPADDATNNDQWMYHLAVAQVEATLAVAEALAVLKPQQVNFK